MNWTRLSIPAVFLVAIVLALFIGEGAFRDRWASGDEVHYLLYSHSLTKDGDLSLYDNYINRDGRPFNYTDLDMHAVEMPDGHWRPYHTIGVSVIVAPVYAFLGHRGAYMLYSVLFGLLALQMWQLARETGLGRWQALLLTTILAGAPAMMFPAGRLYPALPGGMVLLFLTHRLIYKDRLSLGHDLLNGLLVGGLVWLQPRYAPAAAAIGIMLALKIWLPGLGLNVGSRQADQALELGPEARRRPMWRFLALAVGFVLALGSFLFYFQALFGHPLAFAAFRGGLFGLGDSLYASYPNHWGLLGLWFDQEYGLLFYAPILLLLPAGAWLSFKEKISGRWVWLILLATIFLPAAVYDEWTGAIGPQARYILPAVPLMIIPLAAAFRSAPRTCIVLGLCGWVMTILFAIWPNDWAINLPIGAAKPFSYLAKNSYEWHYLLPSLVRTTFWSWLSLAGWIGFILFLTGRTVVLKRTGGRWVGGIGLIVIALAVITLAVNWPHPTRYFAVDSLKGLKAEEAAALTSPENKAYQRENLRASTNRRQDETSRTYDGRADTCWSSGIFQNKDDHFALKLPNPATVHDILINPGGRFDSMPIGYRLIVRGEDGQDRPASHRLIYRLPEPKRFFRPLPGMVQLLYLDPPQKASRIELRLTRRNPAAGWTICEIEPHLLP